METHAELRIVDRRDVAFSPDGDPSAPPLANASKAVPLLWLGLFDYADVQVKRAESREVLAAVAPVSAARDRARRLLEQLPAEPRVLAGAAATLARELERAPDGFVVLYPVEILAGMRPAEGRAYVGQLVNLSDVWERLRTGAAWDEVSSQLHRVVPDISSVLERQEPQIARYFLIGSLAEARESLDDVLVSVGQQDSDVEPQALAVGEQGLLLGRFDDEWRLMSSGCTQDLTAVWGEKDTAYAVGRGGAVVRIRKGRCKTMEVPTGAHLNAVWGLGSSWVCAVGDQGTVLVHDGESWQLLPLSFETSFHTLAGTGPDNICVAGPEPGLLRYDGYAWNHVPLPEEGVINQLFVVEDVVHAVGGTRQGGALYRLERSGLVRDPGLPRCEWLERAWQGWGPTFGVVTAQGQALVRDEEGWCVEQLPLELASALASGEVTRAVGTSGRHAVIVGRGEQGWQVEASMRGLQLFGVWCAESPKPPRLPPAEPPPAPADGGEAA